VKSGAGFQHALFEWFPSDLTNDLKAFGAQSWPDVQRILATA